MSNVYSQKINETDEVDLIELIRTLWKKKLWIILSAFVFTIIAAGYAFTAKEQWTSTTIVVAPRSTDLGNLLLVRAEYARIIGDSEFSAGGLSDSLYGQFKHFLLSSDLKREFLSQSTLVKEYTKEMIEEQRSNYIENAILNDLVVHEVDPNKKDLKALDKIGLKITFSAETPKLAQAVLTDYVNFVNLHILNQTNKEFKLGFDLRLDGLRFSKKQIEESLTEAKKVQVENLTNALGIAKKAGITDFSKGNSKNLSIPEYMLGEGRLSISDSKLADGTYLFMLGEKYLQAQLDIAKNTEIVYPVDYYSTERQLVKLTELESRLDDIGEVKSYYYLSSPDYPMIKDKPKKLLILVIGFLIGLILSSFIILLSSLIQSTKKR